MLLCVALFYGVVVVGVTRLRMKMFLIASQVPIDPSHAMRKATMLMKASLLTPMKCRAKVDSMAKPNDTQGAASPGIPRSLAICVPRVINGGGSSNSRSIGCISNLHLFCMFYGYACVCRCWLWW